MKSKYLYLLLFALIPIYNWGQFVNVPQNTVVATPIDTANTLNSNNPNAIKLINSEMGTFYLNDNNTINVVVGNVIFEHKGERLFADSARLNINNNTLHAYKNVKITQQDGTVCYADYMYYNGNTDIVELVGNVQVSSNMDHLWSDKIIYNLKTNIGYYNVGGVLQSGSTVISSRYAQYNGNTNDARFKGDVNVEDPSYLIVSSDLNYNTNTRIASFYGPSIIKSDSTVLYTTDGYYDTYNEVAQFNKRSSIYSQKQYIEADTMDYDKKTSLGTGRGSVVLLDSVRKINIYGQFATLNEYTGQALVTTNPFAVMYDKIDTTWVIADTFFTEPTKNLLSYSRNPNSEMSAQDSLLYTFDILNRNVIEDTTHSTDSIDIGVNDLINSLPTDSLVAGVATGNIPEIDSQLIDPVRGYIDTSSQKDMFIQSFDSLFQKSNLDTTPTLFSSRANIDSIDQPETNLVFATDTTQQEEPRYLVAYRNVFIFHDSFQAKSDSLRYSQEDTLLSFYKSPVLWTQNQQVLGDVIHALVDSSEIKHVHIPKNGILIAQSTEKNELMFDQIQATEIWAYFSKNEIDSVIGRGNAQTIYYAADDQQRYIGVSKASSMHLKMIFQKDSTEKKKELTDIIYYTDHEQEMTPLKIANIDELKLSRFKWRKSEKMPDKKTFMKLLNSRQYSSHLREDITESINKDIKKK